MHQNSLQQSSSLDVLDPYRCRTCFFETFGPNDSRSLQFSRSIGETENSLPNGGRNESRIIDSLQTDSEYTSREEFGRTESFSNLEMSKASNQSNSNSLSLFHCHDCKHLFGSSRLPIILPCGHSICEKCLPSKQTCQSCGLYLLKFKNSHMPAKVNPGNQILQDQSIEYYSPEEYASNIKQFPVNHYLLESMTAHNNLFCINCNTFCWSQDPKHQTHTIRGGSFQANQLKEEILKKRAEFEEMVKMNPVSNYENLFKTSPFINFINHSPVQAKEVAEYAVQEARKLVTGLKTLLDQSLVKLETSINSHFEEFSKLNKNYSLHKNAFTTFMKSQKEIKPLFETFEQALITPGISFDEMNQAFKDLDRFNQCFQKMQETKDQSKSVKFPVFSVQEYVNEFFGTIQTSVSSQQNNKFTNVNKRYKSVFVENPRVQENHNHIQMDREKTSPPIKEPIFSNPIDSPNISRAILDTSHISPPAENNNILKTNMGNFLKKAKATIRADSWKGKGSVNRSSESSSRPLKEPTQLPKDEAPTPSSPTSQKSTTTRKSTRRIAKCFEGPMPIYQIILEQFNFKRSPKVSKASTSPRIMTMEDSDIFEESPKKTSKKSDPLTQDLLDFPSSSLKRWTFSQEKEPQPKNLTESALSSMISSFIGKNTLKSIKKSHTSLLQTTNKKSLNQIENNLNLTSIETDLSNSQPCLNFDISEVKCEESNIGDNSGFQIWNEEISKIKEIDESQELSPNDQILSAPPTAPQIVNPQGPINSFQTAQMIFSEFLEVKSPSSFKKQALSSTVSSGEFRKSQPEKTPQPQTQPLPEIPTKIDPSDPDLSSKSVETNRSAFDISSVRFFSTFK